MKQNVLCSNLHGHSEDAPKAYNPSTRAGVGHQWTIPTSMGHF